MYNDLFLCLLVLLYLDTVVQSREISLELCCLWSSSNNRSWDEKKNGGAIRLVRSDHIFEERVYFLEIQLIFVNLLCNKQIM